ncbi:hypothetical protein [Aridibaculum aurantiacum]|uniref:hypothetical protein n=1 Tax=Aridibaculum aurantiacum TaxID=2810307 RepID=UPI001A9680C6|nr:hypothetical protein [Aridibaculum aurantiacum]
MRFTKLIFFLLIHVAVCSQGPAEKLKVFIDCSNVWCDFNYIRSEIKLVDFLNDQLAADVHVLITAVENGNGGKNYQLIFFGQNKFDKEQETYSFNTEPNATEAENRDELLRTLKIGLLRFLARTPYAKWIAVDMKTEERKKEQELKAETTKDPWNYWVFRVGVDGTYNAEQVYKNLNGTGYTTANRITDKSRIYFGASGGYNQSIYTYEDNGTNVDFEVINSNYEIAHSLIKSLGSHWGIGYRASYSNNTYSNNKERILLKGGIEYSIFPYSEVNTKLFTISYGLDARQNRYYDTTIYYQTKEMLYGQVAQANLTLNKRWGNLNSLLAYRNYLHDPQLNNLSLNINMNVRITGGLSIYMYTSGSIVRDQVYLVKGKASEQDVLTRRRQIATDYTLYTGFGINYRFGSKLNNFINPRMEGL